MAKSKDVIAAILEADPSGELEVVFRHDDCYTYTVHDSAETGCCEAGVEIEDGEVNCVIIN